MVFERQIKAMSQVIRQTFHPDFIQKTAYDTGFQKRKGKLNPEAFLVLCTFLQHSISQKSLRNLSTKFSYEYLTTITKQGLNQRFNTKAVSFLKQIYDRLAGQQGKVSTILDHHSLFSR
ncbi:hypothetical protein SAMN05421677_111118, partial [Halobacillus aidingensis]